MYLFFDTETSGIPLDHAAPASDVNNWPRLVQIAWALTDENGNELRSQTFIIRPDGFEIPASATLVHGISTETARRLGIDVQRALNAFAEDLSAAKILVAHNIQFDEGVVGAEFFRLIGKSPMEGKGLHCTMRPYANFCELPGGPNGYKWPTLAELHYKLFRVDFGPAHNAATDLRACMKCFFELKRRGIVAEEQAEEAYSSSFDDELLLDVIDEMIDQCDWFDPSFVNSVRWQLEERGFITPKQRNALNRIHNMLSTKVA